jgi:hypothetical protein
VTPTRTAKSCGPDAPTLASSFRGVIPARATVAKEPGRRGEHVISCKTIARGMPGISGVTVVTTLVCFFQFARESAGALSARHSLRPLKGERTCTTRAHRAAGASLVVARAGYDGFQAGSSAPDARFSPLCAISHPAKTHYGAARLCDRRTMITKLNQRLGGGLSLWRAA